MTPGVPASTNLGRCRCKRSLVRTEMPSGWVVNVCQYDSIIQYEPVDTCGFDDFDGRHWKQSFAHDRRFPSLLTTWQVENRNQKMQSDDLISHVEGSYHIALQPCAVAQWQPWETAPIGNCNMCGLLCGWSDDDIIEKDFQMLVLGIACLATTWCRGSWTPNPYLWWDSSVDSPWFLQWNAHSMLDASPSFTYFLCLPTAGNSDILQAKNPCPPTPWGDIHTRLYRIHNSTGRVAMFDLSPYPRPTWWSLMLCPPEKQRSIEHVLLECLCCHVWKHDLLCSNSRGDILELGHLGSSWNFGQDM